MHESSAHQFAHVTVGGKQCWLLVINHGCVVVVLVRTNPDVKIVKIKDKSAMSTDGEFCTRAAFD